MLAFANVALFFVSALFTGKAFVLLDEGEYDETFRPQLHFSQPAHWMNDPNGLVYHDGIYHLFYQYNPYGEVWGPMHWGHAVSRDAIHWQNLPVALFPDSLGTIFSGSAIADEHNVTGLQTDSAVAPLVAIFTQASAKAQVQSVAYSLNGGVNWLKYHANPVLESPGEPDFRDPKIIPYKDHFILALAVGRLVRFYRSKDLLNWEKLSDFGTGEGSHGGVWECPDLFELSTADGSVSKWILIVSINPGGPNGGSGTQYFVGSFDGERFINDNSEDTVLWLDYGPDAYAGITWTGTPSNEPKQFIGWMNNWLYGNEVPTNPWRGQMTVPRNLKLRYNGNKYLVVSAPVEAFSKLQTKSVRFLEKRTISDSGGALTHTFKQLNAEEYKMDMEFDLRGASNVSELEVVLYSSNTSENITISYSLSGSIIKLDRSHSGLVDFHSEFANHITAPRHTKDTILRYSLIMDRSSIELFIDDGLTIITALIYPSQPFDSLTIRLGAEQPSLFSNAVRVNRVVVHNLKSIW